MNDVITRMGDSVVHHGAANDRAYLMKLVGAEPSRAAADLETLARREDYSKIVAKVPASAREDFEGVGYRSEAAVPGFFGGNEEVHFMVKYLDPQRSRSEEQETIVQVLEAARGKKPVEGEETIDGRYRWRIPGPEDTPAMAEVYRQVFATYPFPIHDPAYLRQTMADNVVYFGIWDGDRLIALSSAEMCTASKSVEMTDFATLPECRGGGFATFLLQQMEAEMCRRGVLTAYTIARAVSFGMNITFAKLGYRFGGTLTNNTNISGSLESMNVWYKPLEAQSAAGAA